MTRYVLGLSAYYHDSAAAIGGDGRLIAAVAEERFTRIRHDQAFPVNAINHCLAEAGIDADRLDRIVFYERPHFKFLHVMKRHLAHYPWRPLSFSRSMLHWMSDKLWVRTKIVREVGVDPRKVAFAEHHLSHAAYAFYASPFDEAAILTLDGVGEDNCGMLAKGTRDAGIDTIQLQKFPNSLGLVYAALTGYLGFEPNNSECSTMALASYGQPAFKAFFDRLIQVDGDGRFRIDPSYFDFAANADRFYKPKLSEALDGPYRHAGKGFSSFDALERQKPCITNRRAADVAASLQMKTEEVVEALAQTVRDKSGSKRLCMAGGLAFNAVANSRIRDSGLFSDVFVPPDPGDGGGAVGAMYLGFSDLGHPVPRPASGQIYSGPRVDVRRLAPLFGKLSKEDWADAGRAGHVGSPDIRPALLTFDDDAEKRRFVCDGLSKGAIVGWISGAAEFGPRALGARSILCHPARVETAERLSRAVKFRAAFRPYALSVAEEDAEALFGSRINRDLSRWMQSTLPVDKEALDQVRAAVHSDGTTRPQIVTREDHTDFYELLKAFKAHAGVAALLNTSFNGAGEPLINTAEEALVFFARMDLDILCVENVVITRLNGHGGEQ
ncbi:carbamoyltransferase family protein [Eilatimonas milleporae]|uniref:Carbamoyltransferase n=1 Tax=Eilatimonas milleporae TaxID=911205 RepID=A0A3M0CRZ3_9PROT|nr:carbamoyltransferase N-terminal domain-containing protein [Eilatimonas milleporae]RMB12354.1 carbamoyltransferase [Eilatimonas milleporae]